MRAILLALMLCGCAVTPAPQHSLESALWPAVIVEGETKASTLAHRMKAHQVPGLSVALIRVGQLIWNAAHGVEVNGGAGVRKETLLAPDVLVRRLRPGAAAAH